MRVCCVATPQADAADSAGAQGQKEASEPNRHHSAGILTTNDSGYVFTLPALPVSKLLTDEHAHIEWLVWRGLSHLDTDLSKFVQYYKDKKNRTALYQKPVEGTQTRMVRMEAHVAMRPDSLFRLLTSVEGYKIMDSGTDNLGKGVAKVLSFPPGRTGHAFINFSTIPFPWPAAPREALTCDVVDYDRCVFASESCEMTHGPHVQPAKGAIRIGIAFALRTLPAEGGGARLQVVMWMDLCGRAPTALSNLLNMRGIFGPMMRRLRRHMRLHGLGPDTPPDRWPLDEWDRAAAAVGAEGAAAVAAEAAKAEALAVAVA